MLLEAAGVEVVTSEPDGERLLATLREDEPPDAVIVDIRMPPTFTDEGLQTAMTARERFPRLGVLVLSTYAQTSYAVRLFEHGAARLGYLLKDHVDDVPTVTDALARLTHGESVVDPGIVTRLLERRSGGREMERLTDRERDVLRLMAEGRSNAGISRELVLSAKTVESHVASLFAKLDLLAAPTANRRVLAVLKWLRAADDQIP
jgi:DNA-binding NarL/FixJ family response regulator